jgi:hypothetical protein
MAKIVRTTDNDYRIITAAGGQIVLDTTNATGDKSGTVVIRGDLEINGGTTTIESTISTVNDNILLLSAGNTSAGLPQSLDRPYSSGIEVERGQLSNARWVYDDSITWDLGGSSGIGAWIGTQGDIGSESVLPIKTRGIIPGQTLYVNTGNGVISVFGTNDYEEKIWYYDNGIITPDAETFSVVRDDDNIPNAKAVKDLIDYSLETITIDKIIEDDSKIEVIDKSSTIFKILEVGAKTIFQTINNHGYAVNETITISGVTSSPNDSIINSINGTWNISDIPSANTIEISLNTIGATATNYNDNSGRTGTGLSVNEPTIEVSVQSSIIANFYNNRIVLADIEIKGTEIFTTSSNDDLTISANGGGVVRIKDTLEITKTPGDDDNLFDPNAPVDGIRLYSKTLSNGKTGLFFVNENEYRDELISKNRALLYGMLF